MRSDCAWALYANDVATVGFTKRPAGFSLRVAELPPQFSRPFPNSFAEEVPMHPESRPDTTPSTRARILVSGAALQGRYEGYGVTVARTSYGYEVTAERCTLFAHDSEEAERTAERMLTHLADRERGETTRRYRPHPGDTQARLVSGGSSL